MNFLIRKNKGTANHEENKILQFDIELLLTLFEDAPCDVFLTGGVGLAIRSQEFYRFHKDIDLAIFEDDIEQFDRHLETMNYSLVKNFFMTHISPRYDLYAVKKIAASAIRNYGSGRVKVRGLKDGPGIRLVRRRSEIFDLFLWKKTKEGVATVGYNTTIPWKDFYPAQKLSENSQLRLPNINYKKYLAPRVPRQYIDFEQAGIQY